MTNSNLTGNYNTSLCLKWSYSNHMDTLSYNFHRCPMDSGYKILLWTVDIRLSTLYLASYIL